MTDEIERLIDENFTDDDCLKAAKRLINGAPRGKERDMLYLLKTFRSVDRLDPYEKALLQHSLMNWRDLVDFDYDE
ncbi:hypothetical protein LEP3755_01580 [Leptolyngbya sp. NIES-3755]|nr:hypothetical protein LEP3755_01580 [Leptolyngbya sp. NIES-3755]